MIVCKNSFYVKEDCLDFDYILSLSDGKLVAEKREYMRAELLDSSYLFLDSERNQIGWN